MLWYYYFPSLTFSSPADHQVGGGDLSDPVDDVWLPDTGEDTGKFVS